MFLLDILTTLLTELLGAMFDVFTAIVNQLVSSATTTTMTGS